MDIGIRWGLRLGIVILLFGAVALNRIKRNSEEFLRLRGEDTEISTRHLMSNNITALELRRDLFLLFATLAFLTDFWLRP